MSRFSEKLISAIILISVVASLFITTGLISPTPTRAVDGCSSSEWYNCAQKRKDIDRLITSWCSGAEAAKRQECILSILGSSVETDPTALASQGVGGVPAYCKINAPATDAQKKQIPECYTLIKRSSAWYDAIKSVETTCGTAPNQDAQCAADIKKDFLIAGGWLADSDDPVAGTVGGGGGPASETPFIKRLTIYIRWLFIGIGVLAVFGFIIASIQYVAAQDNSQSVAAAKTRIVNIVYGIVIYMFMFALLQWLIPGGVF